MSLAGGQDIAVIHKEGKGIHAPRIALRGAGQGRDPSQRARLGAHIALGRGIPVALVQGAIAAGHRQVGHQRAQARIIDRAINELRQQPGGEPIVLREPGVILNVDALDVESLLPQHLERGLRIAFKAGFLATGHRQLTRNGLGHDVIRVAHHLPGAVR